ncbi:hypothetical protein JF540_28060 [Salipiger thiooxidans]|uniref:hypothetical protein n=1 Tax=Salipiger thiooxidans TaxID=282683 RepID=UPI001A8F1530|nr:hypothetical protein [Salipiger thiooxidans]MBN8190482.1 hypothetical protein [Salipiger thiooxidans]
MPADHLIQGLSFFVILALASISPSNPLTAEDRLDPLGNPPDQLAAYAAALGVAEQGVRAT